MTFKPEVTVNVKPLLQALRGLRGTDVVNAAISSLNRSAASMRTAGLRKASKELGIPQKELKKKIRYQKRDKARKRKLYAGVFAGLGALSLPKIGKPRQTKTGVTVRGKKYPGAFVATLSNGHQGVWVRRGKGRLPIVEKKISIRQAVETAMIEQPATTGSRVFRKRFNHEIKRRMKRRGLR